MREILERVSASSAVRRGPVLAALSFQLFLLAPSAQAAGTVTVLKDGKEDKEHLINNYLRTVNRCCSRALKGIRKADLDIVGIVGPGDRSIELSRDSKKELRIFFPEKFSGQDALDEATRRIISEILSRRIAKSLKQDNAAYSIPEWIISGIQSDAYSTGSGRKSGIGITLQGAHSLAVAGSLPSLRKLIENPLIPSDGAAWELHGELCRILVAHISAMKPGDVPIREIVIANTSRKDPYAALLEKIKDLVESNLFAYKFSDCDIDEVSAGTDEKMQLWFRYAVMRKSLSVFNPAPARLSVEFLRRIRTMRADIDAGDDKARVETFKVEEIPELGRIKDLNFFISRQEKYITEILYFSNTLLHPELRTLMKSWTLAGKGDREGFIREFNAAAAAVEARAAQITKIEEYLFEAERKNTTPGMLFKPYKEPGERADARRMEIWKKLYETLEKEK